MSILKQTYYIETISPRYVYDHRTGKTVAVHFSRYTNDIAKEVERLGDRFRLEYGTAFNLRKLYREELTYGPDRKSWYRVTVGRPYSRQTLIGDEWHWMKDYHYYDHKADCLNIIYDGFGRVVHPDVIWNAYIKERGALKTKFDDMTWGKCYFRGKRAGCYSSRQKHANQLRFMREMDESSQKIDGAPEIRKSKNTKEKMQKTLDWEYPHRHCDRSWKTQSKRKKQYKPR